MWHSEALQSSVPCDYKIKQNRAFMITLQVLICLTNLFVKCLLATALLLMKLKIFKYTEGLATSPFCARNEETPGQRADLFSARYRLHRPLL